MSNLSEPCDADLLAWLEAKVRAHWDADGKAILNSNLGMLAKQEFPENPYLVKGAFRRLLESAGKFKFVPHPKIDGALAVLPADAVLPQNIADIFPLNHGRRMPVEGGAALHDITHRSFDSNFWKAFHTPVRDRRFVILFDSPSVVDTKFKIVDQGEKPSEAACYEITKDDLSDADATDHFTVKAEKTRKKIDLWLEKHELRAEPFLKRGGQLPKFGHGWRRSAHAADCGRLSQAIGDLDQTDQARIYVPLDLVIKMLSWRG